MLIYVDIIESNSGNQRAQYSNLITTICYLPEIQGLLFLNLRIIELN